MPNASKRRCSRAKGGPHEQGLSVRPGIGVFRGCARTARLEAGSTLKLVFTSGKRGAYLAQVDVVLSDGDGKRPALKFTASAPICLVQAPAGSYRVEASFRDEKRSLAANVAKDVKQPGMLVFRFPEAN